jgi:hypothetical protein
VIVEIFVRLRYVHYIKCTRIIFCDVLYKQHFNYTSVCGENSPKASDRYHRGRPRPVLHKIVAVCFLVNRVLKLQDP